MDAVVDGSISSRLHPKAHHACSFFQMRRRRGAEQHGWRTVEGLISVHKIGVFVGEGVAAAPIGAIGVVGAKHEHNNVWLLGQAGLISSRFAVRIDAAGHGCGAADAIIADGIIRTEALCQRNGVTLGAVASGVAVADTGNANRLRRRRCGAMRRRSALLIRMPTTDESCQAEA